MLKMTKLMLLPKEEAGIHNLIVRLHGVHLKQFKRRQSVVIVNPKTDAKIIRYVIGAGSTKGLTKHSLALDYDGFETLGFPLVRESSQPCDLIVRKAKAFERYWFFLNHPDLSIALSIRLGFLGAVLGGIGIVLGIISMQ